VRMRQTKECFECVALCITISSLACKWMQRHDPCQTKSRALLQQSRIPRCIFRSEFRRLLTRRRDWFDLRLLERIEQEREETLAHLFRALNHLAIFTAGARATPSPWALLGAPATNSIPDAPTFLSPREKAVSASKFVVSEWTWR
jgi:hypothetical protein